MNIFFHFVIVGTLFLSPNNRLLCKELDPHVNAEKQLRFFQDHLRADDKVALSKAFKFPSVLSLGCNQVQLNNRKDFLANFPKIFSARIRDAIYGQDPKKIFLNWEGAFFGKSGEFWIDPYQPEPRVRSITGASSSWEAGVISPRPPVPKKYFGTWHYLDTESRDGQSKSTNSKYVGEAFVISSNGFSGPLLQLIFGNPGGEGLVWMDDNDEGAGDDISQKGTLGFEGHSENIQGRVKWLRACIGDGRELSFEISSKDHLVYYSSGDFIFFERTRK